MKFICNACVGQGEPCILDVGNDNSVTLDSLRCVLTDDHYCNWEKYEDGEVANLQPEVAKLPDWCKVGAWVWFKGSEHKFDCYACVTEINEKGVYGKCPDGQHFYSKPHVLAHARLRPYNAEEMKALVGKVVEFHDNRDLVTSYDGEIDVVYADSMWMNSDELLAIGYTIDGKPCGVLEHLNDEGEWVR